MGSRYGWWLEPIENTTTPWEAKMSVLSRWLAGELPVLDRALNFTCQDGVMIRETRKKFALVDINRKITDELVLGGSA
jgi:hypothetical protein